MSEKQVFVLSLRLLYVKSKTKFWKL